MPTVKEVIWKNGKPYGPCGNVTWYCWCEGWHDPNSCQYDPAKVKYYNDWKVLNANSDLLDKEYGPIITQK